MKRNDGRAVRARAGALIAALVAAVLAACGATVTEAHDAAVPGCTLADGSHVAVNASFPSDDHCNTCYCQVTASVGVYDIACTLAGCDAGAVPDAPPADASTPATYPCISSGWSYLHQCDSAPPRCPDGLYPGGCAGPCVPLSACNDPECTSHPFVCGNTDCAEGAMIGALSCPIGSHCTSDFHCHPDHT